MRLAVIYHYYELNEAYKENLVFFLNTAILDEVDYFFYMSSACSAVLPKRSNIKYKRIENRNNDFGGVVEFSNDNSAGYDAYIFVNSSVRGPFLPSYYFSKWYEIFTLRLSECCAMAGSTINLLSVDSGYSRAFKEKFNFDPPYIHVQTMAYALSSDGFSLLLSKGFFDAPEDLSKNDVILRYEILLSQLLLNNGFNISSILPTYEIFSISKRDLKYPGTTTAGDPMKKSAFYGRTLSPLDCVFIKTNRDLISDKDLASYTFTSVARKEACGVLN